MIRALQVWEIAGDMKKMYKILALLNKPSQHCDVAEYKARDFSINKGNV